MRLDEARFLCELLTHGHGCWTKGPDLPMNIAERLGIHPNRAEYLYQKWCRKGWYDYGVSARTGWLTPEGVAAVQAMGGFVS